MMMIVVLILLMMITIIRLLKQEHTEQWKVWFLLILLTIESWEKDKLNNEGANSQTFTIKDQITWSRAREK